MTMGNANNINLIDILNYLLTFSKLPTAFAKIKYLFQF
jgi:hypothetical protein